MFSPYEPVWTIGRVLPATPGTGASQTYCLWVWPVKIAATLGEVSLTILANAPPAATSCSSVAPSGVPAPAPSWYVGDQQVGLAVVRITVGELSRDPVHRVDRIAEVERR